MSGFAVKRTVVSAAAWAIVLASVSALSDAQAQEADTTTLHQSHGPATAPAADFPVAAPLSESDLDTMRGGQGVEITSTQSLTAESVGNSVNANEVGSGSIALEGDAFSSFNGVANVVVNTGHNNNLQGSVSVNVIYNDPVPPSTP
jgi:hypothetical protein